MSAAYRDTHVSSSDDSEDSDEECTIWKRAKVKKPEEKMIIPSIETEEEMPIKQGQKRKRNTIWCEVLQDQLISEDLEDCLIKNKPRDYGNRGKESYDYTLGYTDPRDSDSPMSDNAIEEESSKPKPEYKASFRYDVKKFKKLNSAELTAAHRINKVLQEKKFYLIQRIVKTVGIEKAMKLLSMTEEVEENGGMLTNNKARRRTPGGVYIQLLKSEKDVTKEMIDKIFEGEMSGIEIRKYYAELKQKKKKEKQNKQKLNECKKMKTAQMPGTDEMLPMDAEITGDVKCDKLTLDNPEPMCNQTTAGKYSDLEEGEIED